MIKRLFSIGMGVLLVFFFIGVIKGELRLHPSSTAWSVADRPIPAKNKKVLDYVVAHGPQISPTYEQAVCTELLIGVLQHFVTLSKEDKNKIRIITDQNVYTLRLSGSPIPKGVYYALISSGKGVAVDSLEQVQPGDFVQFWNMTWGHCGIVKSIDPTLKTMELYSSFPSTQGYGVQTFAIPYECYFVRLK